MLEVGGARALLLDAVSALEPVELPIRDALGLTLSEPIVADRDSPPTDRSAMDGFAVRAADCAAPGTRLAVSGELRAGQDASTVSLGAGEAVRIFTGGVIPRGADAVVMVELTEEVRDSGAVLVKERPEAGQHIRRQGEDRRAGETVIARGTIVRSAEIAVLAAVGRTRVLVARPPRVAVIATGDEVVEPERKPAPHQVRNSNAWALLAQLQSMRIDARYLGIARDDAAMLDTMISDGLSGDALVLTGGVSVGAYDLVGAALLRAGCEVLFHNVAMRPGKPILAARRGACLVLGLPGNPVSAFTGFHVFVKPALMKLMGHPQPVVAPIRATLVNPLRRKAGRLTYHLASVTWQGGKPFVVPVQSASSGDVLSLARANAFIIAPGDPLPVPAGADVDVALWD